MRQHSTTLLPLVAILAGFALTSFSSCGDDPVGPGDAQRGHAFAKSKCSFCHQVEGRGGMIAPPLEKGLSLADTLVRNYEKRIELLQQSQPKAYADAKATIDAVLAEKNHERRFELWLNAYLTDTKFDNPMTKMGNVLMKPQQRADVIAWLMTKRPQQ